MTDPNAEPPLVTRVDADAPLVRRVEPDPVRPRPGFSEAVAFTLGYAGVLFGSLFGIVLAGFAVVWITTGGVDTGGPAGEKAGPVPNALLAPVAWAVPGGYLAGLIYTLVVFRWAAGRGWTWEVGLGRLPLAQLLIGVLALPGFAIASDAIGQVFGPIDPVVYRVTGLKPLPDQQEALRDIFSGFHWSFAVFAIGVCPGVAEELWCRGFLGRGLVGRYGWGVGVALTCLFFGVLHMWPPSYVLTTAVMGAGLHFTYIMSRSLWVPVILHLLNNSLVALAVLKVVSLDALEGGAAAHPTAAPLLAFGLLLAAGTAMWTARARVVPGPTGETVPHTGAMVPPPESGADVVDAVPHPLAVLLALGLLAGLMGILLGWV